MPPHQTFDSCQQLLSPSVPLFEENIATLVFAGQERVFRSRKAGCPLAVPVVAERTQRHERP